ncbi:hypothetical protein [Acinetobacter brisouii]
MSELISGKEALIALANGEDVEFFNDAHECWMDVKLYETSIFFRDYKFRLKPRTIMIGDVEIPAPFQPKVGDTIFYISNQNLSGYAQGIFKNYGFDSRLQFGAYHTEEEIKQVVAALRKLFKGATQ